VSCEMSGAGFLACVSDLFPSLLTGWKARATRSHLQDDVISHL
jgi:hypothetical protein